jgi:DNA-binding CsgD family transcriptional regulator
MKKRRQCDRDELGRRIPRLNTKSAQIYALKLAGVGNAEIARKLGMTAGAVGILWHGICHPELKNRRWSTSQSR